MSVTADRTPIVHGDLTEAERAHLVAWGDEHGLEVILKPSGTSRAAATVFIGYSDGIATWIIYRAEERLWLCDIDYPAGRQCEGSKVAVEHVEQATDRILADTEA